LKQQCATVTIKLRTLHTRGLKEWLSNLLILRVADKKPTLGAKRYKILTLVQIKLLAARASARETYKEIK